MEKKKISDVKEFWENNPLWTGESNHETGSKEFFEEHRKVYLDECFGGSWDDRFLPKTNDIQVPILDLGCGIGFWTVELGLKGFKQIISADLTSAALKLTERRCKIYNLQSNLFQENAEQLTFKDASFEHVNCQGVIHHTPNTQDAVKEINRVLKPGGSASISVYYKNFFLRSWFIIRPISKVLASIGAKLKGRGREKIFAESSIDEIVRLYDGSDNPIGKSYSKKEFRVLLNDYFVVEEFYLHFFPARALPFKLSKSLHRFMDKYFGFMIFARLIKK